MTISNVSRRTDAAAKRSATDEEFQKVIDNVCDNYLVNVVGLEAIWILKLFFLPSQCFSPGVFYLSAIEG